MERFSLHRDSPRRAATLGLLLASGLLAAMNPASAGDDKRAEPAPEVVVRYGDLDLATDAGALTLYRRIANAARRVCPSTGVAGAAMARARRECREAAIERAVEAIGSPKLAAIRATRSAHAG